MKYSFEKLNNIWNNTSIRTRIKIAVSVVVGLSVTLVSGAIVGISIWLLRSETDRQLEQVLELGKKQFEDLRLGQINEAIMWSKHITVENYIKYADLPTLVAPSLRSAFLSYKEKKPWIVDMLIIDENSKVPIFQYLDKDSKKVDLTNGKFLDFINSLPNNDPILFDSKRFDFPEDSLFFLIKVPVLSKDKSSNENSNEKTEIVASFYLMADVQSIVNELFSNMGVGAHGGMALIYHENKNYFIFPKTISQETMLEAIQSKNENPSNWENDFFETSGLIVFKNTSKIKNAEIVALSSKSDLWKSPRVMLLTSFLLFICVIFLAFRVATNVGRRLAKPILHLQDAVKRLAEGDLEARVILRSQDEVGQLASSFNSMADEIIRSREMLKMQVMHEADLKAARAVQESLFPSDKLDISGYHMDYYFEPATNIGGDLLGFYHAEKQNKLYIYIGDVTGHGISSGIVSAAVSGALRSVEQSIKRSLGQVAPLELLDDLNFVVENIGQKQLLMTFCFLELDLSTGEINFFNAAHNPAILISHVDGGLKSSAITLPSNRLGFSQQPKFAFKSAFLQQNGILILYTDGLIEGQDDNGHEFGLKKLKKICETHNHESPSHICKAILDEFRNFTKSQPLQDDITLFVLKKN